MLSPFMLPFSDISKNSSSSNSLTGVDWVMSLQLCRYSKLLVKLVVGAPGFLR